MNKKIILGGIFFVTILLLNSSSIAAINHTPINDIDNLEKNDRFNATEEEKFDGRFLLKQLFFGKNTNQQLNLFTSLINTKCDNVEKTTEITFGLFNDIDVDNNGNTGENGKDIRVQYLLLPYLQITPELGIGAIFSVSVELLGEEIEDSDFSLYATIADNLITVGYESPDNSSNTIPSRIQLSAMLYLYPEDKTTGFSVYMNPIYESAQQEKQINLFAEFDDSTVKRTYSFKFQPASETQLDFRSTVDPNKWQYTFTKESSYETIFSATMKKTVNGISKETTLSFNPLPEKITFSLALTPFSSEGGSIAYQSDTMYDVSVLVETNEIGICKYAVIKNTPRELSAEWIPSQENGFYHVTINSDGTTIYLLNTLNNPTINLSISDLSTMDLTAYWNLTNPGDFEVFKDPSLQIDLDIMFDEWEAEIDAEPIAEHIFFSWKSNISGYLTLDTDQLPLSNIDFLIKGPENGISIFGETLVADDFELEWTVWPLSEFYVDKSGSIDFFSLSIDIYVNDQWYHIWPLL